MSKYHDILKVNRNATKDEIKAAYKRLAREHHPDKGGSKELFQQISEAYEKLMNDNVVENPIQHHQIVKLGNTIHKCGITLEDLYTGSVKRFKITRNKVCGACHSACATCGGTGVIRHHLQMGILAQIIQVGCNRCSGTGVCRSKNVCSICENKGKIEEEQFIQIDIEKASSSEQHFVFKDWGVQPTKSNEEPGDLIVVTHLLPHPHFVRKNKSDLLYTTHISLKHSLIGIDLKIPYFDTTLAINTIGFGIINPNKEYIIYNKGLDSSGNMCIRFVIDYPDKVLQQADASKLNGVLTELCIE